MDINYFTEFVVLAEIRNFTEAAEELYLSQSALSKHIKNMEKELGERLFDRNTKKLELTEYGQLLLEDARKISILQKHYIKQLNDYKGIYPQTLRLGSVHMMPHYGITNILSGFSLAYPSVRLEIINSGEQMLADSLIQKKCELAFMRSCNLPESEVTQISLLDDYFVIVLSRQHPLAKEETLSLQQLQDEQFLLFTPAQNNTTPLYKKLFNDANFVPLIRLHLTNYVNILDLVSHNIGITVMTYRTAHYLTDGHLAIIPLAPFTPLKLSLFYITNHPLSTIAKQFVSYVQNNMNSMKLIEE